MGGIKYRFGYEKEKGSYGDKPYILISRFYNDVLELPPISKANKVKLDFLREDAIETSDLCINWVTEDGKVFIETYCQANDIRLKKDLKENPEFTETFFQFLADRSIEKGDDEFLIRQTIQDHDIPNQIKPFVDQVKIWHDFLKPIPIIKSYHYKYAATVSDDGYYCFVIKWNWLKLPEDCLKKYADKRDDYIFNYEETEYFINGKNLFEFDPQINPPQISGEDEWIFWNLEDKKIRIILPHKETVDLIIDCLNYRKQYNDWEKEKKEKVEKEKADQKEYQETSKRVEDKEKKKKQEKMEKQKERLTKMFFE